jgi:hypothetical protein
MKYDSSMTRFRKDIGAELHRVFALIGTAREKDKLRQSGDPKPLRERLKSKLESSGYASPNADYSSWYDSKGMALAYSRSLNNNGDNTLTLSWSQMTTLLMNDSFYEEFIAEKELSENRKGNVK